MPQLPRLTSLALTIAVVIGAPLAMAAEQVAPAKVPAPAVAPAKAPLPLDELRTFAEVMDRIKAAYVEPVDDKTLLENAIKGMLRTLTRTRLTWARKTLLNCRKAPAANSAAWASKSAAKTVSSKSSRPSTIPRRPRRVSKPVT